jgi:hypothetical protein
MSEQEKTEAGTPCDQVIEHLVDAIEGELPEHLAAHVEGCDVCRDLLHDAGSITDRVREAPEGCVVPIDLEQKLLAAIDARAPKTQIIDKRGPTGTLIGEETVPPLADGSASAKEAKVLAPNAKARARWFRDPRFLGSLALAAAVAVGVVVIRGNQGGGQKEVTASAPWRGTVMTVVGTGSNDGLMLVEPTGATKALKKGDTVAAGSRLRTDVRTRAKLELDDGTTLVLDRGTEMSLDKSENRAAKVASGSVVMQFAKNDETAASVTVPGGKVQSNGAKLAIATGDGSEKSVTSLAVARGVVSVKDSSGHAESIAAGEGGTVGAGGAKVGKAGGLARAFGWSELGDTDLDPAAGSGDKASVPGLGELRARAPGATGDGGKPLKLAKQQVKVRIAGEIARTEIEEVFSSDDPQVLEGIFRFPLPPDAQIERLALDVDGKMEEGAFVDKEKGAAIWRGVIFNATPKQVQQKPQEEWIWVPGPWRDPALLEWKAGGRMELRIFPIPAKGSRRVVLAYTQRITPSAGLRRYVYPLPHFGDGRVAVEDFSLDMQVMGHDTSRGVRVRGYEVDSSNDGADGISRKAMSKKAFTPSGDVVVEYAKKDEGATATTYAFQPASGGASYVALSLAPTLPRSPDAVSRTQVLVVDSSRSMVGERYTRASALAAKVIEEMDPRDRFALLACDLSCVPMAIAPGVPSKTAAEEARKFLATITPEGASNVIGAVESAAMIARGDKSERALRVVYIGDGAPTIGPRSPATLEAGVRTALGDGASLTTVAVGVDADTTSLGAMARGGGGTLVPYVAGEKLSVAALDVLEATYGATLRDVELTLPDGLTEIAPSKLGALRAGDETLVVARMIGSEVSGNATLKGTIGGKTWSTTIPITVRSTSESGNSFVPRLYASARITDLEAKPGDADKAKIIELSKSFAVPSRFTSLIVLESPAMASAFGVEHKAPVSTWTGEELAKGSVTGGGGGSHRAKGDSEGEMGYDDLGSTSSGAGLGGLGGGYKGAGPAATSTAAAPPPMKASPKPMADEAPSAGKEKKSSEAKVPPWSGPGGGAWRKMRREYYRTVSFANDATAPADLETKIAAARGLVIATPDSRDKLADLFGSLARRETLTEANDVMATWTKRDPMDFEATLRRAELAARDGDRARAFRVETGALESHDGDVELADGLAEVAMRAGNSKLACAFYAVRAEVRPNDVDGLARRVACTRTQGDTTSGNALLASLEPAKKTAVEARIAPVVTAMTTTPTSVWGDMVVDATWSNPGGAPADVDLAVVDPKGVRMSWLSPKGVRAADPTSTTHETIALTWASGGNYLIEATRASSASDGAPVSGTVTVRMLGQTKSYPFVLKGARAEVGRVSVNWASRMVEVWD